MKTKSNRIGDIVDYIHNELKNKYPQSEIKALTNILFKHYADMDSSHLLAFKEDTVNESSLLNLVLATEKLKKYVPVQYIMGRSEFCGLEIRLTPDVLIPRPETEELTLKIIDAEKGGNSSLTPNSPTVIDLCCGSGCIALAISKFLPFAKVSALDISHKALEVSLLNNKRLSLNVYFLQADITHAADPDFLSLVKNVSLDGNGNLMQISADNTTAKFFEEGFDIIVSNPPYVTESEKLTMQRNVLDYEPPLALFVNDENPLIFYKNIAFFAEKYLKTGGKMYLEVNNSLASQTAALFSDKQYIKSIEKDIFGKDRFIFLQKKA
ncbi:MAG: peptide chain release factor N(5)-glutamine methyltransferase [Bacteroidales bacterium]|nr:peptide chain release factor N(5)-glutamine methyltransferase [Bacteroidales bacterium]